MSRLRLITALVQRLLGRASYENQLSEEISHHLEARTADLMARGIPQSQARKQALREFGSTASATDACRDQDGLAPFDELRRNLRFAARRYRRRPGQSLAMVATLAACTAAALLSFGLVDAVLLQPLPYPEPERLFAIESIHGEQETDRRAWLDGRTWQVVREATHLQSAVYSAGAQTLNLVAEDSNGQVRSASRIEVQRVGAGYLSTLGVPLLSGRDFEPTEDVPGGPDLVILSHQLWQSLGEPDPLGLTIRLAGSAYTVIGITGDARTTEGAAAWIPLRAKTSGEGAGTNYRVVARLPAHSAVSAAEAELRQLGSALANERGAEFKGLGLAPLRQVDTAWLRQRLLMILGAAFVLLVLGCINVAGLLVATTTDRSGEIRLRRALGGGRGAIARQLFTETLMLSAIASVGALGLGALGNEWLNRYLERDLGLWQTVSIDPRLLAVLVSLTFLITLISGLLPATYALRRHGGLGAARSVTAGGKTRAVLVSIQVALGVALLLVSSLFVDGFARLESVPSGVQLEGLFATPVSLRDARYSQASAIQGYFDRGARALTSDPAVGAAAALLSLPFERGLNFNLRTPEVDRFLTKVNYVSGDALSVLGLPVLQGRRIGHRDADNGELVAVVSATLAEQLFEGEALGRTVELAGAERTIVGVVGDVGQQPLSGALPLATAVPIAYVPATQLSDDMFSLIHTWFQPYWLLRTEDNRELAAVDGERLRRLVQQVDPRTPVPGLTPVATEKTRALASERFQATFVSGITALATVLAVFGLIGIGLQAVSERQREIAVRLALGSGRSRSLVRALRGVLLALLCGAAGGIALGWFAEGAAQQLVYGLAGGATRYFTVTAGVLLIGIAGTLIPGIRVFQLPLSRVLLHDD